MSSLALSIRTTKVILRFIIGILKNKFWFDTIIFDLSGLIDRLISLFEEGETGLLGAIKKSRY